MTQVEHIRDSAAFGFAPTWPKPTPNPRPRRGGKAPKDRQGRRLEAVDFGVLLLVPLRRVFDIGDDTLLVV